MRYFFILIFATIIISCNKKLVIIQKSFAETPMPKAANYANLDSWVAHPLKKDLADSLPVYPNLADGQAEAKADVFFIYPTIFTKTPTNQYLWNASVNDVELNQRIEKSTILNQATVFNGSCKVYSPRYRQAHLYSFYTKNKLDASQALDLAYTDVKEAFEYYLKNYNQGRPIVIASHSQGTFHARRLLKEYFDNKPLYNQLVMAYLVGYDVPKTMYNAIPESQKASQIGCYACWNTYSRGFLPETYQNAMVNSTVTNPLNWSSANENQADYADNLGGLNAKFKVLPNASNALTHNGVLWIDKLNIKGAGLLRTKVWHVADINLFWMNIRQNVDERVNAFLSK